MPNVCIYENRLITPKDIYKYNINKQSNFICYTCDKALQFRQSRNGDKDYTEHFYHNNTIKNTHINCENITYENIKHEMSEFHSMFSNSVKNDCKEVVRLNELKKHIVDGYDKSNNMGIEFQNSKISTDDIISRDKTTELDWIFNVEKQFIKIIEIGNMIICEIPHNNWEEAVKVVENNVFLYTGCKEWIWLSDRESYRVEIEGRKRHVWVGEICSFQDVLDNTCLQYIITNDGMEKFTNISKTVERTPVIYARCKKSMYLLDEIHRNYIDQHNFKLNEVVAIKSVAGSGKTTTLLNLANIHINKRILYVAFNKSLIVEIKDKIKNLNIKNLIPKTFDALLYSLYISIKKDPPIITDLRPQFLGDIISWFKGQPYKIRDYYCKNFKKFCNDANTKDIETFNIKNFGKKKPLLENMWNKVKQNNLITFESIRKQAYINRWFKNYIDENYDMIMIDETQDFDMIMLKMILEDTTVPKIFVGDPKQSLYQFRGCINAFNYLPQDALIIEFYSTFRVGNPACDQIREKFDECWMITKCKTNTYFVENFDDDEDYTYLFRSWRVLLQTAENLQNIWIYGYDNKINEIRNLHNKLSFSNLDSDEDNKFEDDLPMFLKSLNSEQLEKLIENISNNIVSEKKCKIKLTTTHSYKGMEDNNIRMGNDINDDDDNIFYVALTRGKQKIVIDK